MNRIDPARNSKPPAAPSCRNPSEALISHDVASAFHIADYIAFLYEGAIVSYGPPSEVRNSTHPFVAEFLGTWFKRQ